MPEMFLINLRHTLPTSISTIAMKRALRTAISIFFAEARGLDEQLGLSAVGDLEERMIDFIDLNL